jgi:hypothetical protein
MSDRSLEVEVALTAAVVELREKLAALELYARGHADGTAARIAKLEAAVLVYDRFTVELLGSLKALKDRVDALEAAFQAHRGRSEAG